MEKTGNNLPIFQGATWFDTPNSRNRTVDGQSAGAGALALRQDDDSIADQIDRSIWSAIY
jgi:hypothetical protein